MVFHFDRISALLIKARTSKGFSQTYIAQQLRISQKAYSYIESGHCKLELTRFLKIAHLTEIHPMEFIEKITEGNPSWESNETKEAALSKEIQKLESQISLLKLQNSHLRGAMDKLLEKK
jgi:transcriptional regulator with XRE-family HTH domain